MTLEDVPFVDTFINEITICLTPDGIPVKSIAVPEVEFTGVPSVNPADTVDQVGKPEPALVSTCPLVPAAPAKVKAVVRLADAIVGAVNVLLVRVSVVARPTNVSVLVGSVNVPVLLMLAIIGVVNVLLVSVCVAVTPTTSVRVLLA